MIRKHLSLSLMATGSNVFVSSSADLLLLLHRRHLFRILSLRLLEVFVRGYRRCGLLIIRLIRRGWRLIALFVWPIFLLLGGRLIWLRRWLIYWYRRLVIRRLVC